MSSVAAQGSADPLRARIEAFDWSRIAAELDDRGCAVLSQLLTPAVCNRLRAAYSAGALFRRRVVMARHNYGRGEYQYFAYPLPEPVATLRAALYPRLVPVANRWCEVMRLERRFPPALDTFLERCHRAGQARPTPLLLRYGPEDYNCLHQDLYGEHVFPLQIAVLLSAPGREFEGGEFVLTEQRPRMQSRVEVVPLRQGDAVAFAVNERPEQGTRGWRRVKLRHGVSRVRSGERYTLGIIFHDAA
ncbi:MAG: proline hydroxylase [Proteobacteria bacterium]|nr:MAG: proline hydroxylase [Pseudomonadota bacterium]